MAAKRYDHKALSEAIRQGQARMKRMMQSSRAEQEPPAPPVPKQPDREHAMVGMRPMRAEQKKPYRFNQGTFVIIAVFLLVIAFLFWVNKSKERRQSEPTGAEKTAFADQTKPKPVPSKPAAAPQSPKSAKTAQTPAAVPTDNKPVQTPSSSPTLPAELKSAQPAQEPPKQAGPEKDHVIVIATYTNREHLIPVQAYFEANGIKTEIMRRGSYYLLVTKDRFDSPLKAGTDGQQMLNKIKSLGAQYKAPDGYENFGRTPFQDAYGMKVKTN
jgi:hypothetical protein